LTERLAQMLPYLEAYITNAPRPATAAKEVVRMLAGTGIDIQANATLLEPILGALPQNEPIPGPELPVIIQGDTEIRSIIMHLLQEIAPETTVILAEAAPGLDAPDANDDGTQPVVGLPEDFLASALHVLDAHLPEMANGKRRAEYAQIICLLNDSLDNPVTLSCMEFLPDEAEFLSVTEMKLPTMMAPNPSQLNDWSNADPTQMACFRMETTGLPFLFPVEFIKANDGMVPNPMFPGRYINCPLPN